MPRRPIKPKDEEEVFAAEATEASEGTGVSPAEVEEREETKVVAESVELLREVGKRAPRLFGIPSGVDGLDDLFFTTEIRDGKPTKKPLGGFPSYAVVNITGVPDTGKSLMVEQFAIKQASLSYPVLFVTIESPAPFVAAGLRAQAQAMGVDYEAVQDKIVLVDAASYGILHHSLPTLLNTLAHAIKTYNTKSLVVDSVTGLYEAREVMARDVVRTLFNFAKKWRQTALFVSQNMMVAHATTSVSCSHAFLLCWALLHKSVTKAVLSPSLPHLSKHLLLLPSNSPPYNSSHLPSPSSCSKSISSPLSHFPFLPNSLPLPYRQISPSTLKRSPQPCSFSHTLSPLPIHENPSPSSPLSSHPFPSLPFKTPPSHPFSPLSLPSLPSFLSPPKLLPCHMPHP